MSHKCKNILISCMDFRLRPYLWEWLNEQGYTHDTDVVSVAGAAKEIADGSRGKDFLLKQIDAAYKQHEVRHIILLHHSDCGAYAQDYKFKNAHEEQKKQITDMKTAAEIIESRYFDIDVVPIWAELKDKDGKNIDFSELK